MKQKQQQSMTRTSENNESPFTIQESNNTV